VVVRWFERCSAAAGWQQCRAERAPRQQVSCMRYNKGDAHLVPWKPYRRIACFL